MENGCDIDMKATKAVDIISCQSGAAVALTRESPDGTYLTYFPFGLLTEASLMRRYHKKLQLGQRVRDIGKFAGLDYIECE